LGSIGDKGRRALGGVEQALRAKSRWQGQSVGAAGGTFLQTPCSCMSAETCLQLLIGSGTSTAHSSEPHHMLHAGGPLQHRAACMWALASTTRELNPACRPHLAAASAAQTALTAPPVSLIHMYAEHCSLGTPALTFLLPAGLGPGVQLESGDALLALDWVSTPKAPTVRTVRHGFAPDAGATDQSKASPALAANRWVLTVCSRQAVLIHERHSRAQHGAMKQN